MANAKEGLLVRYTDPADGQAWRVWRPPGLKPGDNRWAIFEVYPATVRGEGAPFTVFTIPGMTRQDFRRLDSATLVARAKTAVAHMKHHLAVHHAD